MSHDEKRKPGGLERRDAAPRELEELREPMVPLAYAEKTMSSLLRLHEDLVEEKERRIDLYRRLMDREQQLAELKAYVRLLEAEKARWASLEGRQAKEEGPATAARPAAGGDAAEKQRPSEGGPSVTPRPAAGPHAAKPSATEPQRGRSVIRTQEAAASGPSKAPILVWAPGNLPHREREREGGGGIASPGESDGRTE